MDDPRVTRPSRPAARASRHAIEEELRRRIREGVYPPGSRIPTQRILARQFGSSSVTLQRAIDRLAEFGLVEARGRLGTFVRAARGGGGTVALVFPDLPNQGGWNRFIGGVRRSGERHERGAARFRPYFIEHANRSCASARRLQADAADGALDGAVFVFPPWYLDEPLFSLPLPRVVIGGWPEHGPRYRATVLTFDPRAAERLLLRGFAAAGRRRLGVLRAVGGTGDQLAEAAAVGLESRPEWIIPCSVDAVSAPSCRAIAHLLCSRSPADRPDCLLIDDDNLVPHATAGILDAGLEAADIAVAAHANFPDVTRSAVSCQRYGMDLDRLLELTLAEIDRLAAGGTPQIIEIEAECRTLGAE